MGRTRGLGLVAMSLLLGSGGVALAQVSTDVSTQDSKQDSKQVSGDDRKTEARDARLEKAIEVRLEKDDTLKFQGLDATVMEGKVTLTGTTGTQTEKLRAARLATGVKGVSDVDNQIIVRGSPEAAVEAEPEQPKQDQPLPPDGKTPPANERRQDLVKQN